MVASAFKLARCNNLSSFGKSDKPHPDDVDWTGFDLSVVTDDNSSLSDAHRSLIDYFNGKTGGKRLARRDDLNPAELAEHLSNIYLHDLIFDQQGLLSGVMVRLFGTDLVDFFGETTGQCMQREEGGDNEEPLPQTNARMFRSMDLMLKERAPVIAVVEQVIIDKPFVQLRSLRIPLSQNGTDIDMVFGHAELISTGPASSGGS